MSTLNKSDIIPAPRRFLPLDDEEIFARAGELMERHRLFLDPAMSMETLAAEIGVHKNSLSRVVNRFAGVNFPQWLAEYRVAEAERLAREEKIPLDRIAKMAGFRNRSTFQRVYRRLRGNTPSAAIWAGLKKKLKTK